MFVGSKENSWFLILKNPLSLNLRNVKKNKKSYRLFDAYTNEKGDRGKEIIIE